MRVHLRPRPGALVASLARNQAAQFADFLHGPPASASRPAPGIWSPLEYACHVRDVLLVQRERVLAARRSNTPVADPMGRDEHVAVHTLHELRHHLHDAHRQAHKPHPGQTAEA
ncbi:hypothetical protein [Streptomyces sp. NPDC020817]|uniref:hypothetical protein n=1 Tax=Streptomyces sp. NPDC020817 TaxID=3365095 RepID=UPI00379BA361